MSRQTKSLEVWCHENGKDDLLDDWNREKNMSSRFPKQPSEIAYDNPLDVNWKCHESHEWECSVVARTIFNLKCPICYPDMSSLPIGTKYGCLTIIGGFDEYEKDVAIKKIAQLEQDKAEFLQGKRKPGSNVDSVDFFDRWIQNYKTRKYYKCQCKCGKTQYLDEFHFLEKKHRYCPGNYSPDSECGLKKRQRESLLESYERVYDKSYNIDFTKTIYESLEVLECIDDNYEELYCEQDKRKKGGGTFRIYKRYKCRCYLCGKEQIIKSSDFSINPPTPYGHTAYNGYYSKAYCDCHKISSFQWIVTKILSENKVPYRVEFSFPNLYGTGSINLLRYDFAVLSTDGSIKCLIECQGEQHFKPVDEFGGKFQFEIQKINDELKRTYAGEHGIPLHEIPYTSKKYESVVLFLKSKMII